MQAQPQVRAPVNPSARLFTPLAVALHTLLFTPFVGSLIVVSNWTRVGEWQRGVLSVVFGFVALIALGAVGAMMSPEVAVVGIGAGVLGLTIGWYSEQVPLFETHKTVGGETASAWPFTLVGVLVLTAFGAAYRLVFG